jgi:hydroxyacylglutathione hydrolase
MAGILYHSDLRYRGDGAIVCPAHGAGAVCGEAIVERVWTTIGMEHLANPS